MSYLIHIQNAAGIKNIPKRPDFKKWATLAMRGRLDDAEVTIRVVDETESATLNQEYRKKTGPTNVLSFPFIIDDALPEALQQLSYIGDLAICAEVVLREAEQQHKDPTAHWAHMVIHGCLHLLGYDHIKESEAAIMEDIESNLLQELGYPNPYAEITNHG